MIIALIAGVLGITIVAPAFSRVAKFMSVAFLIIAAMFLLFFLTGVRLLGP